MLLSNFQQKPQWRSLKRQQNRFPLQEFELQILEKFSQ